MQRIAKRLLIAVVASLLLVGLALLVVNIYAQSASMQARIETKLGKALRLPLKVSKTSFTPWGGFSVVGVQVPQDPVEEGRPHFMAAQKFHAKIRLLPLFRRHLVLENFVVEAPTISWPQDKKGKWRLPRVSEAPKDGDAPKPVTRSKGFDFQLNNVLVRNGSFGFYTNSWEQTAQFTDVTLNCSTADKKNLIGTITSGTVALREKLFFQNLRTPFRCSPNELRLEKLEAEVCGGTVEGVLLVKPEEQGTPFTGELGINNVDANRLIEEIAGEPDRISGNLSGTAAFSGLLNDNKSLSGQGRLELANGRIANSKLLATIGSVMRIDELVDPAFQKATLDFRLGQERVYVDRLVLGSNNLTLEAMGTIKFNRKLDLKVLLTVNETISRHLPKFVLANFQPGSTPDLLTIAFDVSGTMDKPKSNLLERMAGQKIEKEVTDLFQSLFFGPKKK